MVTADLNILISIKIGEYVNSKNIINFIVLWKRKKKKGKRKKKVSQKKVSGNNDNLETPTYFIFHIKEDKTRDIASKNML